MTGRRIAVQGTVQGVGFRPWVYQLARRLHVAGTVKNGPEGVTIDAFAPPSVLDELLVRLERELPPAARIDSLEWKPLEAPAPESFTIIGSDSQGAARASIPADLAMCDACRAEIHDPSARRFHYPFTNCTHCGPRFSIATAIPYDRPRTTMAGFPLCPDCRREYEDPDDRRFHAQPIACPRCGPKLTWLDAQGTALTLADPLAKAADALTAGAIVAVRGLGGFHLACDALDETAVRTLRQRKHRDEKPLAVMVSELSMARRFAALTDDETKLLTSAARPIVLARMKEGLAPSIAPGFTQVGLFLPYTPLHELLLALAGRPLVMTSGNRSEEPMAVDTDEAVRRLAGIADGFLTHDRPIATRTDDSVARVVEGAPMLLRRARGFVPESLASPISFTEPVLAVGGQLKNTFCIGKGARLTPGPHVGDLGELSTFESFTAMAARLEQFLEVSPRVIAHDLHPDYDTTRYARERGGQLIAVQHHHAHIAAVMAEHGLKGPVLGVAFDGTGYGDDGAAWGGEVLRCTYAGFERVGTLRPIPLAGGERAIRDAWRLALAVLDDAFDGAPPLETLELFRAVPARDVRNVRQLLPSALKAHGAGRAFDAAAALAFARPRAAFEAQLAMMLEQAATPGSTSSLFELARARTPWELDLRPFWRAAVTLPAAQLASLFHGTLAAGLAAMVRGLADGLPVILSGGCFANAVLTSEVLRHLDGLDVRLPRKVPAGDGGLALGQAVVAAARLEGAC